MVWARRIVHLSLVPWALFAVTVLMALAAADQRGVMTLVTGVWSYGPLALLSSLAARMLWSRGRERAAVTAIAIPLAILAVVVLGLAWGVIES